MKQEIERISKAMSLTTPGTKEYQALIDQLKDLREHSNARELKLIEVGGKFAAIVLILYFERSGAIISKAFGFIRD